jgi:hypothetical protein
MVVHRSGMCVEDLNNSEFHVETGFADYGSSHPWDWERFVDTETGNNIVPQVVLYKLHGSINWKRSKIVHLTQQTQGAENDSQP